MNRALPLPSAASSRNFEWITKNSKALARRYPNRWIAANNRQVLAANPDLGVVRRAVSGKADPDDVVFHFIDDGSLIFVLL